jgi:hypothetical protein
LLLVILTVTAVAGWLRRSTAEEAKRKVAPLSLDGFRDEKLPEPPRRAPRMKVDNSACYVCHENYATEEMVVSHGKEKVGCIDCHGTSFDHRNDEDNITPPDVMYAPDQIEMMCFECHLTHKAPATSVITRWQQRCPNKTSLAEIVCTDCHYQHRLETRVVRWDKKTRRLIARQAAAGGPAAAPPDK